MLPPRSFSPAYFDAFFDADAIVSALRISRITPNTGWRSEYWGPGCWEVTFTRSFFSILLLSLRWLIYYGHYSFVPSSVILFMPSLAWLQAGHYDCQLYAARLEIRIHGRFTYAEFSFICHNWLRPLFRHWDTCHYAINFRHACHLTEASPRFVIWYDFFISRFSYRCFIYWLFHFTARVTDGGWCHVFSIDWLSRLASTAITSRFSSLGSNTLLVLHASIDFTSPRITSESIITIIGSYRFDAAEEFRRQPVAILSEYRPASLRLRDCRAIPPTPFLRCWCFGSPRRGHASRHASSTSSPFIVFPTAFTCNCHSSSSEAMQCHSVGRRTWMPMIDCLLRFSLAITGSRSYFLLLLEGLDFSQVSFRLRHYVTSPLITTYQCLHCLISSTVITDTDCITSMMRIPVLRALATHFLRPITGLSLRLSFPRMSTPPSPTMARMPRNRFQPSPSLPLVVPLLCCRT